MNTPFLKFILIASFLFGCFLLKSYLHRSISDVIKDNEEHCQPKTRIAFAKTHKTGSSTIQVGLKSFQSSLVTLEIFSSPLIKIFAEHSLSLWRFQPPSLCASKLRLWSWQVSTPKCYQTVLEPEIYDMLGKESTCSTCPVGSTEEWSSNTRVAR